MKNLLWALGVFVMFVYIDIAKSSDYPPIDMNDPITRELRNRGAFIRMNDAEFIEYWHELSRRAKAGRAVPNTPLVKPADNREQD